MTLETKDNKIDDELISMPNKETLEAIEDAEYGRNMIGPFDSVDELFEELNS